MSFSRERKKPADEAMMFPSGLHTAATNIPLDDKAGAHERTLQFRMPGTVAPRLRGRKNMLAFIMHFMVILMPLTRAMLCGGLLYARPVCAGVLFPGLNVDRTSRCIAGSLYG